jgi:uncharacterized protein (TIGR03435 family)
MEFFRAGLIAIITAALMASSPSAQTSTGPSFEIASVKPVKPQLPLAKPFGCTFGSRGERFMAFGTLRWLIACAYDIRAGRAQQEILGGPRWIDLDLFQIEAKATPEDVPAFPSQAYAMLRTLLSDRFKLAVHRETQEVQMYALVLARRDGTPGPHLRPTTPDCAAWIAGGRRGAPPRVLGDVPCGLQRVTASGIRGAAMTMARFADMLSPRVDRPVQDRTALGGNFDLEVQWTPEPRTIAPSDARQPPILPPVDPNGPSVFAALEDQLGLKLESMKGSLEVLVIDSVDHPTPD